MPHRVIASLLACCLLLIGIQAAAKAENPLILRIQETQQAYSLSVPVSKLVMTIPRGVPPLKAQALEGSPDNPRYFSLTEESRALFISGWFESADGFKGIAAFWQQETADWKKNGLPEPRDVSFEKIGNWDAIVYETAIPEITNSHIRAHLVQSGTWIDIHLSVTTKKSSAENRALLESLLRGISVSEKK